MAVDYATLKKGGFYAPETEKIIFSFKTSYRRRTYECRAACKGC